MRVGEFFRGSTRARPMGRWVWVLATLGIFVTVATVGVTPAIAVGAPHRGDEFGPGCASDRAAVAHYADGVIATGHHGPAPIPCTTATGFRTSEISLVVTNKGTLLFEPALATESPGLPIGVLRSTDQGASWKFINPATTGSTSPRTDGTDENMWVDRETGRVFWSSEHFGMPLGDVDHSNTDGQSWSTSASTGLNVDHTQIFSGPPVRSMRNSLHGYPDVIYLTTSRGGAYTTRSMDGGQTWAPPAPISYPADCPFPGSDPGAGYGLDGVVGEDGTIYLPFTPCEEPYVAISHDEGTTWQLVRVANTETIGIGELGLGTDKAGNLYTAWTAAADRLPYLSVSRDHGLHWSTPLMIGAPGVNEAAEPQLAVGKTGQVAVTYYGSANSPGKPFPPLCLTGTIGAPPAVWSTETA